MAVYKFQVSVPVTTTLPRDRFVNVFHMDHVAGAVQPTDLTNMANDIVALWNARFGRSSNEIMVKIYDAAGPPPHPPLKTHIVNAGSVWAGADVPNEVALCVSYAGPNRNNRRQRGRMYLAPQLKAGSPVFTWGQLPDTNTLNWAADWYRKSNESFPDLGGVDWKFGVWSPAAQSFTQTTQYWVDNEWDTQRRRGRKATTRVSGQRDG